MDNPNPIYYRDLVTPDDSITTLIDQLGELITTYDGAKSKIQGAAAEIAKGLQSVSGASDEQRKSIQLATEQSEKLIAEYRDVTTAQWQAKQAFEQATAAKKESAQIDKLITQINTSVEGSYNRLSAQYRLNKIRLNELSAAERAGTDAGRKLEAETKAIYEEMNRLQKATGKSQLQVGQYERSLGNLVGVKTRYIEVLTDSTKRSEAFHGVLNLLKSPIAILIGTIGGLTAAFKLWIASAHETQTTGDALDREMAGWSATWDLFKKSVASVDFSLFIRGAIDAMNAGRELKRVLDETFERSNSTRLLKASLSVENAALEEAARDSRLSYEERLAAADKYLENMKPIYEQETETAKRTRDAQLEYLFTVTNKRQFASEEARKAAEEEFAANIKNYNLNEDLIKQAMEYNKAQKTISQGMEGMYGTSYEAERKIVNNASEAVKAFAGFAEQYGLTNDKQVKAYVDAEEAYLNAQAAVYNDQKRFTTMRNSLEAQQAKEAESNANARAAAAKKAADDATRAEQEAAKERERIAKEEEARKQQAIADERAYLQAQLQNIQLEIANANEWSQQMLDLRIVAINKQREIEIFENKQKAEKLRQDEAAINKKYDAQVMRETANFNTKIAERDLAALMDLNAAENELLDQNERQRTIFRLEQEKFRLQKILELNETAAEKMTDMEIAAVQKTIEGIEKQISRTGYNNIYELLGLNITPEQQSAIKTAVDAVKESIGSIIESWNAAADAAVNAADKQVESAQRVLDAEIEARNAGYANEVTTAQKELELAKKNQEQAIKEKQKAQKAQLAIDTLSQTSSLITASANIWSGFTAIQPAPLGLALAIAALATLWGSFAASKVKAAQVAGVSETYGDGTVELLQGGSHASGHDIDLGTKPNGTRRRAEGGEYFAIINKRNSRRYGRLIPDVINAFNDGTFAEKYRRANAEMGGYAIGLVGGGNTDVSGLEKDVAAIRQQGDRTQYVDGQGNTIIRYKNLTRKVYKN